MTWYQKPPLGTPLDWENPLNKGTVMALAMNEGNGDKVQDLSLNGNHGTLNNFAFPPTAASGWNPGQTGIGLNLDGGNDHVNYGNSKVFDFNGELTVSALFNASSIASNYHTIISKGWAVASGHSWSLVVRSGTSYFFIRKADNSGYHALQFTDPSLHEWHSIVVTAAQNDKLVVYMDGVQNNETPVTTGFYNSVKNVKIGEVDYGTTYSFVGSIDQPRVMNRVWAAKEVKDYAINPWQVYLDEDN